MPSRPSGGSGGQPRLAHLVPPHEPRTFRKSGCCAIDPKKVDARNHKPTRSPVQDTITIHRKPMCARWPHPGTYGQPNLVEPLHQPAAICFFLHGIPPWREHPEGSPLPRAFRDTHLSSRLAPLQRYRVLASPLLIPAVPRIARGHSLVLARTGLPRRVVGWPAGGRCPIWLWRQIRWRPAPALRPGNCQHPVSSRR
jgi:hypothetical protein